MNLALLISEVIDSYNGSAVAKKQTIRFQQGKRAVVAKVDKEKVRMALENILDNASKYSPNGKDIDIRLKRHKNHIAIAVHDNGVGILRKNLHKLFKKFSRIENAVSTSVGGTGLGLYWSRKIIALHRGTIKVSSSPDKGSTFTVLLPHSDA